MTMRLPGVLLRGFGGHRLMHGALAGRAGLSGSLDEDCNIVGLTAKRDRTFAWRIVARYT